ncbi:hypothetical protein J6590_002736 [Homalodisca vitripennis]|nr:hypothetical protein J6590_002736 [Homalodisca vitripennis]
MSKKPSGSEYRKRARERNERESALLNKIHRLDDFFNKPETPSCSAETLPVVTGTERNVVSEDSGVIVEVEVIQQPASATATDVSDTTTEIAPVHVPSPPSSEQIADLGHQLQDCVPANKEVTDSKNLDDPALWLVNEALREYSYTPLCNSLFLLGLARKFGLWEPPTFDESELDALTIKPAIQLATNNCNEVWFQQDRAPLHYGMHVLEYGKKPSLTLNLGTNGLKVTSEPPPMAGQAGCSQGQDRSAVTYPSSSHARRCLIRLSCDNRLKQCDISECAEICRETEPLQVREHPLCTMENECVCVDYDVNDLSKENLMDDEDDDIDNDY